MKKLSDETLQQKYLDGIRKLSENVGSTLGPKGQNVIMKSGNKQIITKDGVTVAKFFDLEDPFENLAVQILKESSIKTSTQAGDGTTTTIVLADAIYRNALNYIRTLNISPILLKREIDKVVENLLATIDKNVSPIKDEKDIENVATISANNDPNIGKLIAQAFSYAGTDGAIKIENSSDTEDSIEVEEGYQMFSGYITSSFITDKVKHITEYANPLIAITDETLETAEQLIPALQISIRCNRPLIIIADSVEDQALAALIANQLKGTAKVVPINAPRYFNSVTDVLGDLAVAVGAKLMNPLTHKTFSEITLEDFGECEKISIGKNRTIFSGCKGTREDISNRISLLNSQIVDNSDMKECEVLQERINRLSSCVVSIKIGAPTEIERDEKFYRVEDALEAVRAAIIDGILPGGGISLMKIFKKLPSPKDSSSIEYIAHSIIKNSLEEPIRKMLENAGHKSIDTVISKLLNSRDFNLGFNIYNERYCNMLENGIIEPVRVVRASLINSTSVATMLLTSNHAIIEI